MAFQKKKKPRPLTKAEQAWIEEKLNASKKWHKPLKGRFVYKRDGSTQEVVCTARYNTEEELKADAESAVARMNELDKNHHWTLLSCEIVGRDKPEEVTNEEEE